jgi:hypothetical protein
VLRVQGVLLQERRLLISLLALFRNLREPRDEENKAHLCYSKQTKNTNKSFLCCRFGYFCRAASLTASGEGAPVPAASEKTTKITTRSAYFYDILQRLTETAKTWFETIFEQYGVLYLSLIIIGWFRKMSLLGASPTTAQCSGIIHGSVCYFSAIPWKPVCCWCQYFCKSGDDSRHCCGYVSGLNSIPEDSDETSNT